MSGTSTNNNVGRWLPPLMDGLHSCGCGDMNMKILQSSIIIAAWLAAGLRAGLDSLIEHIIDKS
jgi:hypothetical protein